MVSWISGVCWGVSGLGLFGFVFLVRVGRDIVVSGWGVRGCAGFGVFEFGFVLREG